jgi:hypothetical protein
VTDVLGVERVDAMRKNLRKAIEEQPQMPRETGQGVIAEVDNLRRELLDALKAEGQKDAWIEMLSHSLRSIAVAVTDNDAWEGSVGDAIEAINARFAEVNAALPERETPVLVNGAVRCDGWDGGKARAITDAAIASVRRFLTYQVAVVPTVNGGIQLEWHAGNVDMELEFDAEGRPESLVGRRASDDCDLTREAERETPQGPEQEKNQEKNLARMGSPHNSTDARTAPTVDVDRAPVGHEIPVSDDTKARIAWALKVGRSLKK